VPAISEAEALQKEVELLKAELLKKEAKIKESETSLTALKSESEKQLKAIETEFLNFKNKYSKENPPSNKGLDNPPSNVRKPFKNK